MKLFLSLFFSLLFVVSAKATTFYISPTGNDVTGTGSVSNPWKTLYKACNTVAAAGDIIHVNAGTYLETQQCVLRVGVSIEGDGVSSVLQSTLTADWTEMLSLKSAEGTNGNQHISNIKFDGQNLTTFWGVYIAGRSNVSVHDITMVNFKNRGIIFAGRSDNALGAPSIYATGNTFYNNTVDNCADYDQILGYGAGALCIGGQEGMLIYNNTITQNSRPAGHNGWPIKYQNDGYLRGCKIYNNTLNKVLNAFPLGGNNWDFAIELFNEYGLEIYNNVLNGGGVDINHTTKGGYAFGAWIHDNTITMPYINTNIQTGVTMEFESDNIIVENNTIDKVNVGLLFTPRPGSYVTNITIRKNLITNVGMAESTGFLINMGTYGASSITWNNVSIYNNTMLCSAATPPFWGIKLPNSTSASLKNISIKNNIIANAYAGAIVQQGGSVAIDSLNISYNDIYGNGSGNTPVFESPAPAPTHYTYSSNLNTIPTFGANYTLTAGSPLIDAGVYVGLPYAGTAPDRGYAEAGAILPINLLSLTVTDNKGKNLLQWKTASEINSDYFTIEHSTDGINFETAGTVKAAGYSSTELSYSFTDASPVAGINYYRLVMIDKDKSRDISNVVSITTKKNQTANFTSVQLSAGRNTLSIAVNATQSEKALLILFDANGRVLLNSPVTLQAGLNRLDKTTGTIAKGIYYVKLATASETVVKNVMATE